MAEERVRIVTESMLAHNARDIEGIVATVHPDVEIELIGGLADVMGRGSFSGHQGVRRFFADWFATFKTVHVEHEQFFEAGEKLVSRSTLKATVDGSPVPVELVTGQVWSFEDGKIRRWEAYYEPSDAFEAVGLSDGDALADS